MKKVALKIAYIGTNFHGFQRQPNHRTVEGEMIYTLKKLGYIDDLADAKFQIAARTDKGVHSLGNVISFMSDREIIVNQINQKLPDDIQIIAKAPVRYGFKARYAQCKHYRYTFFEKNLNIQLLNELAKLFEGRHDFTNFSKRKENQKSTIRTIDRIDVMSPRDKNLNLQYKKLDETFVNNKYSQKSEDSKYLKHSPRYTSDLEDSDDFLETNYVGELKSIGRFNENFENVIFNEDSYSPIFVDVYGESFLWNMIRKMMRIFLFVGKEEMELETAEDMLNPDQKYNIKPLNPENLILMDIQYNGIKFQYDDYALEGFKRTLVKNLFDYKIKLSLENSLLNSMESLKSNIFYEKNYKNDNINNK